MTAKCVNCGLSWNVSILHKIPRTGYTCPHCDGKRKGKKINECFIKSNSFIIRSC